MNATEQIYRRGWDRAFAKQAADLAGKQAAAARLEAAAERGAALAAERSALLTVKQVAERLKVTDRTVRNLIQRGALPTVLLPGTKTARRIEPGAVDALIAAGREVRK